MSFATGTAYEVPPKAGIVYSTGRSCALVHILDFAHFLYGHTWFDYPRQIFIALNRVADSRLARAQDNGIPKTDIKTNLCCFFCNCQLILQPQTLKHATASECS